MIDYELLNLIPEMQRGREYRLYDGKGNRFLDLYQLGGKALGGHRPAGLSHRFKNVLARGIWGELPGPYAVQLKTHVSSYFPNHPKIILFPHRVVAEEFLKSNYGDILDPAMGSLESECPAIWRPLCDASYELAPALMARLPFPGDYAPVVVCLREDQELPSEKDVNRWEGDCSPLMLASLIQAVTVLPSLADNIDAGAWRKFDKSAGSLWSRRGPYLEFKGDRSKYGELFREALKVGVILHPGPQAPSILPPYFTDGEMAAFRRLMNNYGN